MLLLDPNNVDAADLKEIAAMARHKQADQRILTDLRNEWKWQFHEIDMKTVGQTKVVEFPEPEIWLDVISKRIPRGIAKHEDKMSDAERKTLTAMTSIRISLNFTDTPLPEVVSFMQEVTQLNIMIDRRAIEDPESKTVTFKVEELAFDQALDLILKMADLAYRIDEGVIVVTSKEAMMKETVLELYDVQDLTIKITNFKAPEISLETAGAADEGPIGIGTSGGEEEGTAIPGDDLKLLISQNISPGTWDTPPNSIEYQNGILIVRHTPAVQGQINAFLQRVRESTGLLVTIESGYRTVQEHLLEDVGVDFRGLDGYAVMDDLTIPPLTGNGFFDGWTSTVATAPIGPQAGFVGSFGPNNSRASSTWSAETAGQPSTTSSQQQRSRPGVHSRGRHGLGRSSARRGRTNDADLTAQLTSTTRSVQVFVASQIAYIRDYDIESRRTRRSRTIVGTFRTSRSTCAPPSRRAVHHPRMRPTVATRCGHHEFVHRLHRRPGGR